MTRPPATERPLSASRERKWKQMLERRSPTKFGVSAVARSCSREVLGVVVRLEQPDEVVQGFLRAGAFTAEYYAVAVLESEAHEGED